MLQQEIIARSFTLPLIGQLMETLCCDWLVSTQASPWVHQSPLVLISTYHKSNQNIRKLCRLSKKSAKGIFRGLVHFKVPRQEHKTNWVCVHKQYDINEFIYFSKHTSFPLVPTAVWGWRTRTRWKCCHGGHIALTTLCWPKAVTWLVAQIRIGAVVSEKTTPTSGVTKKK